MNPPTNLQDLQELKSLLMQGLRTVKPHAAQCLEGTRTSILADVDIKTSDHDGANIIHIYGAPGSGKSSISLTAKSRLQRQRRLITYFRFDRNEVAITTPTSLWCHVAYDLARLFPSVLSQLLELLRNDEVNLDSPKEIFTSCIEDVLSDIPSPVDRPLVIIIDAIDECGGLAGRLSSDRQILLQTLRRWSMLPKHFKLLVTSRPEGDITRVLSSIRIPIEIPSGHFVTENPKLEAAVHSSNDIRMFLEDRFQNIRQRLPSLSADWPGSDTMNGMVHRAAGIFMWATTAANFIDSGIDPNDRLHSIMEDGSSSGTMKPLYSLYSIVLEIGFGEIPSSGPEVEILQSVLGTMVLAKRPLVDVEYTKLPTAKPVTQLKLDSIRDGLRSVIAPGSLRFVHKSFDDFLLSEECPPKYAIKKDESHYLLTQLCLTTMREGLFFNICGLQTSYLRNVDVPDIANKVANGILPLLSYSCLFFADHLGLVPFDEYLGQQVQEVMLDKLLFWFEAMSLLKEINRVAPALVLILKWLHVRNQLGRISHVFSVFKQMSPVEEFKYFLHDARRFIRSFGHPIAQSAPHLYISALPFAPENSSVAKHFLPHFPGILALSTGKHDNWPSCIFTLEHHTEPVNCVAFSTDEEYFVTGSDDTTICVFDSETGNLISGPFKCDDFVYSVFFHPDSHCVGAACRDGKVIRWDIETGDKHRVIRTQASYIDPCHFNCRFDGSQKIISAGKSIALWNGETGRRERVCRRKHEAYKGDKATSISPDGCYIAEVTGQRGTTIRIIKVVNGSGFQKPPRPHSHFEHRRPISALSFSVDSTFAVSGSEDGTVLIWDASTGDTVGPPLSTGDDLVSAVAYSPKSHLIASADDIVTIWNASTQELLGRLEGHTSPITDIALSCDGQRVLTTSYDRTVRMWDLGRRSSTPGAKDNQDHMSTVEAVAFSRCGKKLVSLESGWIQGWDTNTGKSLFEVEIGRVYGKLLFSPDGSQIVGYDVGIGAWNTKTGEPVYEFDLDAEIYHVAFRSTDGVLVLCSDREMWNVKDGVPQIIGNLPHVVALSPDGLTVIVRRRDGKRRLRHYVWSTTTHDRLPLVFADTQYLSPYPGEYSPSGLFFASLYNPDQGGCTLRVWNMRTGGLAGCFSTTHSLDRLAFSPDDRYITSSMGGRIWIFDVCTGQLISGPWSGHTGNISTLAFSPDGRSLASGAEDRQVRIWNVANMLEDSQLSLSNWGVGTRIEDGWVKVDSGELLFWVPSDLRSRLVRPHSRLLGDRGIAIELNLSRFENGERWTECYSGGDSSGRATN